MTCATPLIIFMCLSTDDGMQTFFPFNEDYISSRIVQAPKISKRIPLPRIELVKREKVSSDVEQLTFQPHLPGPGFLGSINVTASVLDWSLPKTASSSQYKVSF